jgi:hypothetical protein
MAVFWWAVWAVNIAAFIVNAASFRRNRRDRCALDRQTEEAARLWAELVIERSAGL